jgi:hypothetical protein
LSHYKKRFTKKSYQKVFTQKSKSTKNPKPIFLIFVYHVFGRFSVRGAKKHHPKNLKKNLTRPLTTGVTDIFWPAPQSCCRGLQRAPHFKLAAELCDGWCHGRARP